MELLTKILLGLFFLIAVGMTVLILLQRGKGSDLGAVFGGGSQSVFGSRGSANFLTRITAVLATLFFGIALSLAYIYSGDHEQRSVTSSVLDSQPASSDMPSITVDDTNDLPQAPE